MLKRWIPFWAIPVLIIMATGTVWLRLSIIGTTYDINQAEKILRQLQKDRQQLELKLASLRSPRRLEALAKSKFDLKQPRSDQIIHLAGPSPGHLPGSAAGGTRGQ
ncbi:MAG TPA: hypothetical protein DCS07_12475 [Bdellovibrionales bacterium]|nr:MAG: hypothetical protein A2Z97_10615 [Bdellovibrionales bacterium GWB1_52_6]OFZ02570.1 MAG: hypothetical protein A2X97_07885 [Bdellovibrionales bacterium GWA1_52_35]OFZ39489.1 MAG: hypothetical protein A2070_12680 [Bdellovibrionales bacterium GWC1_52_8]HAR43425.1 hypothetical protein [Bdellovibrionales bacterium]HCM41420.1 hypothetical protein [Bdellovibrionales bacterium]